MSEEKATNEAQEIVIVEGQLRKVIHAEGTGEQPKKGQEVSALYRGTLQNGDEFDSNQDRENPFKFTLGQGMVIKGWDEGFASMKVGERATLICSPDFAYGARGSPPKIPPNATLNFEVELLGFQDKPKEKWELSTQEKVQEATKNKNQGNQELKKSNFLGAIAAYKAGIESVDNEENVEAKNILKVLRLNLAQAYLKANNSSGANEQCTKVLKDDPANVKALFRRGVALTKLQDFTKAQNDFKELLKHDPENGEAKRELVNINNAIKQFKEKEKKVYGSIFSKAGLYEDKKAETVKQKSPQHSKIQSEEDEEPIKPELSEDKHAQEIIEQKPAEVEPVASEEVLEEQKKQVMTD